MENLKEEFLNAEILDILNEYDGPKLFTIITKTKKIFLVYYLYDNNDGICWLYCASNQDQIRELIKNEITIRDFFSNSYILYKVTQKTVRQIHEIKMLNSLIEIEEYIPKKGVSLNINQTNKIQHKD